VLLAPLIGPSVGGYIVEYASWRMIFLLNVPIGLIDIVLAYKLLKETPRRTELKLDTKGFVLSATAFPCLLLGFSRGSDLGWTSPVVLSLFTVGALALIAFVLHELHHRDPMLRLRLFSIPMFRLSLFTQWLGIFSIFGLNIVIPLYLQRVHEMSPAQAGQVLLPMGFVAFATMNLAGRLYNRLGPRPIVVTGLSIMALTTFAWSRVEADTSTLVLMILVCGRGLGMGMFGQILQVVSYNAIPSGEVSRATSLVNVCQRLSTAFATATLTTVLIIGLSFTSAPEGTSIAAGDAPVDAMVQAFRYAFYVMTAISIAGLGMGWFLRDHMLEEAMGRIKQGMPAPAGAAPAPAFVSKPNES
jgi:EmrB/QacA subfamily drug resistance transporter